MIVEAAGVATPFDPENFSLRVHFEDRGLDLIGSEPQTCLAGYGEVDIFNEWIREAA